MPNLWRKKNKSYGVSGKDTQGSLSAVRPLSAAFGTTELRHLDEDEAINKKAKYGDYYIYNRYSPPEFHYSYLESQFQFSFQQLTRSIVQGITISYIPINFIHSKF